MECIKIGMKLNQKWNRPSLIFKQVQVRGVPWPLVQQSLAIGLEKGKLKFSGQQHPQKIIKKSDFPISILTSCLQSVIAPKRIERF